MRDSNFRDHDHQHVDEKSWMQADDFFLKALHFGETEISVKILEKGYENIAPAQIKITVVNPFVIKPLKSDF